jgi:serine/threonine protein kinase/tetratricopeptide (TPR) repeat protein
MAAWNPRANDVFMQAVEIHVPDERRAYLDDACSGDADLRAQVEALLRAGERAGSFLEAPAPGLLATSPERPGGEAPGTVIGPYKLLQQIGEGGMGAVFMAEQAHPVQRKVALKIIKPGMDSAQVIARFEAERQALALMDHPNIARVLDAGATASVRPYFVMELVKGVPITRYCDEHRLTPKQRLELFLPVCQAVQHAHTKGVIHRDLKPSNVLVAEYDDRPVAKVIDFGVAKATGPKLTERTLFTEFGQVVGTLEYMSPEQAKLNALDVDTRSDIYALGVLAYELLTGTTPFDAKRLRQAAFDEMLRIIREEEPPKPSTRLSTTEELPSIAANRGLEPKKLSGVVRGELDWIVMRCLEKDRNRRYETAGGLARDVERYLADEPVQACPPSAGYRLRKFARRHRTGLAVAGLVLCFIVLLGGGLGWVAWDRQARQAALEQEVAKALDDGQAAYEDGKLPEATAAVQRAEQLLADGGGSAGLKQRVGQWQTDLKMVARLEKVRLERAALKDGQWENARADAAYREVFRQYGLDVEALDPDQAGELIRAAAIRDSLIAGLDDWLLVKWLERVAGRPELLTVIRRADADPWRNRLRQAVESRDKKTLEDLARDPEVPAQPRGSVLLLGAGLRGRGLTSLAVEVLRQAQRRCPDDFWINFQLCTYLLHPDLPRPVEAIGFGRAAVALRPGSPVAHLHLGNALDYFPYSVPEAEAEFRKAIDLDPNFATAHFNLGNTLRQQGKLPEAATEYHEAIRLEPDYEPAHINLGQIFSRQNKLREAEAEFREAVRLRPDDPPAFDNLVNFLDAHGKLAEAETEYRQMAQFQPANAYAPYFLATILAREEKWAAAIAAYKDAIRLRPDDLRFHLDLARLLTTCPEPQLRDPPRALAAARKAVELAPNSEPAGQVLGWAQYRAGNWKASIEALEKGNNSQRPSGGDARQWFFLAMAHGQLGETEEARKWYDKACQWQGQYDPYDVDVQRIQGEAAVLLGMPGVGRGRYYAERGDWKRAAAEFTWAFEQGQPKHPDEWFEQAFLRLQAGDVEGYRKLCVRMRERFGASRDLDAVVLLAHGCVLGPDALGDAAAALRLAEQRLAMTPPPSGHHSWSVHVVGLAYYRAGQYPQAVEWLNKGLTENPGWGQRVYSWLVLSMAHQRLGHAAEAQNWFDKAQQWIAEETRMKPEKSTTIAPPGWLWRDWLGVQLFRREAAALLKKESGANRPPSGDALKTKPM